jgi:signal transduction histidine kinase
MLGRNAGRSATTCRFGENKSLQDIHGDLIALADYVRDERETILLEWLRAVRRDPALHQGDSLPRAELFDHIPALLAACERSIRQAAGPVELAAREPAAAHGLQRWQEGYDLREVTRELGQLNKCVILALDRYAKTHQSVALGAMAQAREIWTDLCSAAIEESVTQYFDLQQQEAAGHVEDLERALEHIRELEQQRGDLWRQAAHDLRGNLGVVANVAVGLTRHGQRDESREDFVRILTRNVTSLHHLLNDVTSLARLQAGREKREIEPIDVTTILEPLGEGIRPLAQQRGLYLRCEGPPGLAVDGDAVKIRRIAQNLVLNAVRYTRQGGITMSWGDSAADDSKRWLLTIQDTGPGFHTKSGQPLAAALEPGRESLSASDTPSIPAEEARAGGDSFVQSDWSRSLPGEAGEGIGLSIVKRLCEMLDATIETQSVQGIGTTFRVLFPTSYASDA